MRIPKEYIPGPPTPTVIAFPQRPDALRFRSQNFNRDTKFLCSNNSPDCCLTTRSFICNYRAICSPLHHIETTFPVLAQRLAFPSVAVRQAPPPVRPDFRNFSSFSQLDSTDSQHACDTCYIFLHHKLRLTSALSFFVNNYELPFNRVIAATRKLFYNMGLARLSPPLRVMLNSITPLPVPLFFEKPFLKPSVYDQKSAADFWFSFV